METAQNIIDEIGANYVNAVVIQKVMDNGLFTIPQKELEKISWQELLKVNSK